MTTGNPRPGWYLDPDGRECDRFWDGTHWTLQTRPKTEQLDTNPSKSNQKISPGWWFVIVGAGFFSLIAIAFLASDPNFYNL
jgi:hypothetical protein